MMRLCSSVLVINTSIAQSLILSSCKQSLSIHYKIWLNLSLSSLLHSLLLQSEIRGDCTILSFLYISRLSAHLDRLAEQLSKIDFVFSASAFPDLLYYRGQ